MNKLSLPVFIFERMRHGKRRSIYGEKYGPYLYRDITNNTLLASWDKPKYGEYYFYKGEDIGYNTDAMNYYKNI